MGLYLTQPDHILGRTSRIKTHNELHEKYPDHYILSLSFLYSIAWDHMRDTYGLTGFPPPLVVDHTKKYPHRTSDDGGDAWAAAFFNRSWAYSVMKEYNGKRYPDRLNVQGCEIRVYSRALRRDFDYFLAGYVTPWVLNIMSMHVFFHELSHYRKAYNLMEEYKRAKTDEDRYRIMDMLHIADGDDDVSDYETFKDEQETERQAINLTRSFLMEEHEDDLGIKLHGPMDNFLVRKNPEILFHQTLLVLEHLEMHFQEQYSSLEAYKDPHVTDEHVEILTELANCFPGNKKSKYIISD